MSSLLEESHEVRIPAESQAGPSTAPIESFQRRQTVLGVPTELLIQTFDDRILVVVTQNGKVGCLMQASLPAVTPLPLPARPNGSAPSLQADAAGSQNSEHASSSTSILASLPPPPVGITLLPLLGAPPNLPLYELYTSQLSTLIWWSLQEVGAPRRPVVLGLALARAETNSNSESERWRDEEEDIGVSEGERERFAAVCGMVAEWDGPRA